eukprot:jgi/Bigna1/85087/estExt_fgenesh1_pg.C_20137
MPNSPLVCGQQHNQREKPERRGAPIARSPWPGLEELPGGSENEETRRLQKPSTECVTTSSQTTTTQSIHPEQEFPDSHVHTEINVGDNRCAAQDSGLDRKWLPANLGWHLLFDESVMMNGKFPKHNGTPGSQESSTLGTLVASRTSSVITNSLEAVLSDSIRIEMCIPSDSERGYSSNELEESIYDGSFLSDLRIAHTQFRDDRFLHAASNFTSYLHQNECNESISFVRFEEADEVVPESPVRPNALRNQILVPSSLQTTILSQPNINYKVIRRNEESGLIIGEEDQFEKGKELHQICENEFNELSGASNTDVETAPSSIYENDPNATWDDDTGRNTKENTEMKDPYSLTLQDPSMDIIEQQSGGQEPVTQSLSGTQGRIEEDIPRDHDEKEEQAAPRWPHNLSHTGRIKRNISPKVYVDAVRTLQAAIHMKQAASTFLASRVASSRVHHGINGATANQDSRTTTIPNNGSKLVVRGPPRRNHPKRFVESIRTIQLALRAMLASSRTKNKVSNLIMRKGKQPVTANPHGSSDNRVEITQQTISNMIDDTSEIKVTSNVCTNLATSSTPSAKRYPRKLRFFVPEDSQHSAKLFSQESLSKFASSSPSSSSPFQNTTTTILDRARIPRIGYINVGDCVYLNSPGEKPPYIVKILEIYQECDKNAELELKINAMWFYRFHELKDEIGKLSEWNDLDFSENEIFESDIISLDSTMTIIGHCPVRYIPVLSKKTSENFFCRFKVTHTPIGGIVLKSLSSPMASDPRFLHKFKSSRSNKKNVTNGNSTKRLGDHKETTLSILSLSKKVNHSTPRRRRIRGRRGKHLLIKAIERQNRRLKRKGDIKNNSVRRRRKSLRANPSCHP